MRSPVSIFAVNGDSARAGAVLRSGSRTVGGGHGAWSAQYGYYCSGRGSLIVSGTGTLIQCLGLGHLGSRLPICMGSAFVFIAPSITVGSQMGIRAVFGASMVCGFVARSSVFIGRVQKLIPPLVTGTIVSLIGIKLLPLGFTACWWA